MRVSAQIKKKIKNFTNSPNETIWLILFSTVCLQHGPTFDSVKSSSVNEFLIYSLDSTSTSGSFHSGYRSGSGSFSGNFSARRSNCRITAVFSGEEKADNINITKSRRYSRKSERTNRWTSRRNSGRSWGNSRRMKR